MVLEEEEEAAAAAAASGMLPFLLWLLLLLWPDLEAKAVIDRFAFLEGGTGRSVESRAAAAAGCFGVGVVVVVVAAFVAAFVGSVPTTGEERGARRLRIWFDAIVCYAL
jgi:hypothetical protein